LLHAAWLSLIIYLNDKAEISEVCEGTNKKNDRQYYLDRKRNIGGLHGQAPILWYGCFIERIVF